MHYPKKLNFALAALAALTFIATALQTVLLIAFYDPATGLYQLHVPQWPVPAAILCLLAAAVAGAFTAPKGDLPRDLGQSGPETAQTGAILVRIGGLLILLGAALSGLLLFYGDFAGVHAHDLLNAAANGSAAPATVWAGRLLRFSAYLGILAAVWPAILLILGQHRPGFATIALIWLLCLDLSDYLDNSAVINDPVRQSEILGLSVAALWLIAEIRRGAGGLGRRGALLRSMAAGSILCVCSVPRLIATAAGTLVFSSRTLIPLALLGFSILIGGRICQIRRLPEILPDGKTNQPTSQPEPAEPTNGEKSENM